jgi:alpha-1,3-fucosyltransferase
MRVHTGPDGTEQGQLRYFPFLLSLRDNILPPYRTANHRWVFYNLEPPTYLIADGPLSWFKPWWLNATFNFTSSYSRDDDMPQPYGKCEKRLGGMGDDDSHVDDIIRHKMKMVAWFVSNCKTFSVREKYVEQLKRFNIPVSVYGACGDRVTCSRSEHCENDIHRVHKFYLAFENSLCQDYVTEKAFRPMLRSYSAVPIVMGLADYASILPPHSYIDVRWFPSAQSLARYLVYLDGNVTEYSKYFAWRRHYKCDYYSLNFDAWCDEGLRLYDVASEESSRFKQWKDAGACVTPEVYWRDVIPASHDIHIPSFT